MTQDIFKNNGNQPPTEIQDEYQFDATPTKKPKQSSLLSGSKGVLFGIGLGALLTLGGTKFFTQPQTTEAPQSVTTAAQAPAQSVTVSTVQLSRVNRTLKATGTVTADELITVNAQANGLQIQEIYVDEGASVSAGQLLARLDDSILQAQLAQAQASVAQAEARLAELRAGTRTEEIARARESVRQTEADLTQVKSDWDLAKKRLSRNQTLEAEGAIARDRLDEAINDERSKLAIVRRTEAELRENQQKLAELQAGPRSEVIAQATAQLAQAKSQVQVITAQLRNTRILSPVNGKITQRNARVGDTTNASSQGALFEIIEAGRLELHVKIPENQLTAIRIGQKVEVTSDADSNLKLIGTIREINPVVDVESRQATVKVDLPFFDSLKPGMFLRASIVTNSATSITVPMEGILPQSDGQAIAYIVQPNNTVIAQTVSLGEILPNNQIEITNGLKVGERIVIKGAAYLNDGDKIQIKS